LRCCRAWLLLFSLSWVMGLKDDLFQVFGQGISGRDLVLLFGGLFLLYKASHEIFVEVEAREEDGPPATDAAVMKAAGSRMFWAIIGQIAVIDIVFSLDSVITAVGMVDQIGVMVAAVVTSVAVMLVAAKPIGEFVDRHPSVKVLALAFLVMVGMALTAEAFEMHMCPRATSTPRWPSRWRSRRSTSARAKRLARAAAQAREAQAT
jgi:predicted tellurium resistance membrane protein TerC